MRSNIIVVALACVGQTSCKSEITDQALEPNFASNQAGRCETPDVCAALLLLALGRATPELPSKARLAPRSSTLATSIPRRNALTHSFSLLGLLGATSDAAVAAGTAADLGQAFEEGMAPSKENVIPGIKKSEWLVAYEDFMFTEIPRGSVASRQQELNRVLALIDKSTDDGSKGMLQPYIDGAKSKGESDIEVLLDNSKFVQSLSSNISSGRRTRFLQEVSINVPDMAAAVTFWTQGLYAFVLDTQIVNGVNVTRVAYGSASLDTDDGAKFVLRLVESNASNDPIEYIQLGFPRYRATQILKWGGEIDSVWGWTNCTAPGGLQLRIQASKERDPFMFVALRTSNLDRTIEHYEKQGMTAGPKYKSRPLKKFASWKELYNFIDSGDLNFFPEPNALLCARDEDSVLMSYGDESLTTGLLLIPPKRNGLLGLQTQQEPPIAGGQYPVFRVLVENGGPRDMILRSPDGPSLEFVAAI